MILQRLAGNIREIGNSALIKKLSRDIKNIGRDDKKYFLGISKKIASEIRHY